MGPVHKLLKDASERIGPRRDSSVLFYRIRGNYMPCKARARLSRPCLRVPRCQPGNNRFPFRLGTGRHGNVNLVEESFVCQRAHAVVTDQHNLARICGAEFDGSRVPAGNSMFCRQVVRPVLSLGWFFRDFSQGGPILKFNLHRRRVRLLRHLHQSNRIRAISRNRVPFIINLLNIKGIFKRVEPVIMYSHLLPSLPLLQGRSLGLLDILGPSFTIC